MKNILIQNPEIEPVTTVSEGMQRLLRHCCDTVRAQLSLAASLDPITDESLSMLAYDRALKFLKMSAKIGLALGKIKGEFTNNIRISKPDDVRELHKRFLSIERTSGRTYHVYEEALPEEVFDSYEAAEEGAPPQISGGSNGGG